MREAYEFRHCCRSGQWAERGLWIKLEDRYGTKTPVVAWCFPVDLRGLAQLRFVKDQVAIRWKTAHRPQPLPLQCPR